MGGINQAQRWIVTVGVMVDEVCIASADAIAGKPAPTMPVYCPDICGKHKTCGSGLAREGGRHSPALTNNPSSANKSGTFAT